MKSLGILFYVRGALSAPFELMWIVAYSSSLGPLILVPPFPWKDILIEKQDWVIGVENRTLGWGVLLRKTFSSQIRTKSVVPFLQLECPLCISCEYNPLLIQSPGILSVQTQSLGSFWGEDCSLINVEHSHRFVKQSGWEHFMAWPWCLHSFSLCTGVNALTHVGRWYICVPVYVDCHQFSWKCTKLVSQLLPTVYLTPRSLKGVSSRECQLKSPRFWTIYALDYMIFMIGTTSTFVLIVFRLYQN